MTGAESPSSVVSIWAETVEAKEGGELLSG